MPNQTDALVTEHLHFVRIVAGRIARILPPSVDLDDLVQEGSIALMQAAAKFQPGRKVPFKVYAYKRIRGAMLSSVRGAKWPEHVHLPIEEADDIPSPESLEDEIEATEQASHLERGLKLLPVRQERILRLSYHENRHDGQIAPELGICQNWVGEIRRRGVKRLISDLRGLRRAA
jgi:RNA polymerase sigma factor (sigma-70 family)